MGNGERNSSEPGGSAQPATRATGLPTDACEQLSATAPFESQDENFDPPQNGTLVKPLTGVDNSIVTAPEEYFQPPIIRERGTAITDSEAVFSTFDGDEYFEPPIIREQNLKKDDQLTQIFGEFQKCCPILWSDLISALDSL